MVNLSMTNEAVVWLHGSHVPKL
uniref:Uncharacterized protein n=1 Tax=Anguilla anguilla TaxID=7936 RepID=A0A0E9R554_ANGAN